jgi:hypothetical protein
MTLAISPTVLVLRLHGGGGAVLGVTVPDGAGAPGRNSRSRTSHPTQAGATRWETLVSTSPDAGACQPAFLDPVKAQRLRRRCASPDGRSAARLIGTIGPVDGPHQETPTC